MIFLFRIICLFILGIFVSFIGVIFCLFNPKNPKNVARFAHLYGLILRPFLGIKVITRASESIKKPQSRVYIANHQNNYDVPIAGEIVQPKTVTVGKKSLVWIPFFGQLYWLSGNILLDRNNKSKARDTLGQVVAQMKKKDISIWMFPEGTRSNGRGLLPFKAGAFRTAIEAGAPIVPICISDTTKIKLNRWNNGFVIVEMLEPIETAHLEKQEAKKLMDECHQLMQEKIASLNQEVLKLNQENQNKTRS